MKALEDHERALLLVLKDGSHPAEAFEALLDHPEVRAWQLPPLWALDHAGIDLIGARPQLGSIRRENLRETLDALLALADEAALERLSARLWREVEEPVRQFYLNRSFGGVFASMMKMAPSSRDLPPSAGFKQAQVFLNRFEMEYRLDRPVGQAPEPTAPPEEGSLVLYPFDVRDTYARGEVGLPEGGGPTLEVFAYAGGRERHTRVFEDLARGHGWHVLDPVARTDG